MNGHSIGGWENGKREREESNGKILDFVDSFEFFMNCRSTTCLKRVQKIGGNMPKLCYTSSARGKYLRNIFADCSKTQVLIAVAFFTDLNRLKRLVDDGYEVKLVFRLSYPTNPDTLERLLATPGIQARFVTSEEFHVKFYIFRNQFAVIGSANLTDTAFNSNQELCVALTCEEDGYDETEELFAEYWRQATVLNESHVKSWRQAWQSTQTIKTRANEMKALFEQKQGETKILNLTGQIDKTGNIELKVKEYERKFQAFLDSFRQLRAQYTDWDERVYVKNELPLRLEIDSFLDWIRKVKLADSHDLKSAEVFTGDRLARVSEFLGEWFSESPVARRDEVLLENYQKFKNVFGDSRAIRGVDTDELIGALACLHSVSSQIYLYGGADGFKEKFLKRNNFEDARDNIAYLLHGQGPFAERIVDCLNNKKRQVNELGQSRLQELFGWVNSDDIPIRNERSVAA
ncbi:phospholipase D family protein, partial [bacterium]|nr:phospholipase D family protein [bacterium]